LAGKKKKKTYWHHFVARLDQKYSPFTFASFFAESGLDSYSVMESSGLFSISSPGVAV